MSQEDELGTVKEVIRLERLTVCFKAVRKRLLSSAVQERQRVRMMTDHLPDPILFSEEIGGADRNRS